MTLPLAIGLATFVGLLVGGVLVGVARAYRRDRQIQMVLATFGPLAERAASNPQVLLAWHPVAETARRLFPAAFAAIETAAGERFPFGPVQIEAAHARWTTDWLEWERANDAEHRHRSAAIEEEIDRAGDTASSEARARLDALERERLERYQRRYEEYVRVSRALAELGGTPPNPAP